MLSENTVFWTRQINSHYVGRNKKLRITSIWMTLKGWFNCMFFFQMSYIPSGFWSRLVTRLMVSVQRWRNAEGIDDEKYSLIYWREGLGVVYQGGHFLVESYRDLVSILFLQLTNIFKQPSFLIFATSVTKMDIILLSKRYWKLCSIGCFM